MVKPATSRNLHLIANNVTDYLNKYVQQIQEALHNIDPVQLDAVLDLMTVVAHRQGRILVGGNGGSAAIAEHLSCDWMKGTWRPGKPVLSVVSLNSNMALTTALANDWGYENVLAAQIDLIANPRDAVVLISSSGSSENIIKAAQAGRARNLKVVGLSGFDGGELKGLADISLHVPIMNYGIVEDAHQLLMHVLAQYFDLGRCEATLPHSP